MQKSLDVISLNIDLISPLTIEYAVFEGLKILFPQFFSAILIQLFLLLADKQNWHNILCLNLGLIAACFKFRVTFEHCKLAGTRVSDRCLLGYLFMRVGDALRA